VADLPISHPTSVENTRAGGLASATLPQHTKLEQKDLIEGQSVLSGFQFLPGVWKMVCISGTQINDFSERRSSVGIGSGNARCPISNNLINQAAPAIGCVICAVSG